MKILVISQYYYPENFRVNDICEELARRMHNVTVLTGLPNYPDGYVPDEYRQLRKRRETINGVKVIRCHEIGRRRGMLWLAINYVSFAMSSTINVLRMERDYDVVYIYQPSPVFTCIPAYIYKKITNKKILLYCCDLWPESLKTYDITSANMIFKMMKVVSEFLYKKCDLIAVTSDSFTDYLNKVHDVELNRIHYLPQHAENIFNDMDVEYENDRMTNFMFCGNVGRVQDVECIIRATYLLRNRDDIKVHIVGDGSNLIRCRTFVKKRGLDEIVIFHGKYPLGEMAGFYKKADAFLLTLKGDSFIGMTVPSKLQGYMAAGKPIIGAIKGAAADIINVSRCGVCVEPGNSRKLAEVMLDFVNNKEIYYGYGLNGRDYFNKHFTKMRHVDDLLGLLNGLVLEETNV